MENPVYHNEKANRFETPLDNGQFAYLEYLESDGVLTFTHTYVPRAYEGRGIAAAIVKSGLEYAQKNDFPIKITCPYVSAYIERHPEFKTLIR